MEIISRQEAKAKGLKTYFTGKPCKNGGIARRKIGGCGCYCIHCVVPERERARQREFYRKNPRRYSNRTRNPESDRRYYARHKDEINRRRRAKYLKDPAKYNAWSKATRKRHPEIVKAQRQRRRARKKAAFVEDVSPQDLRAILKRQKCRCAECPMSLRKKYHVDHIMPLARGGKHRKSNLQLLCPSCNASKGHLHPVEWARRKGRLL